MGLIRLTEGAGLLPGSVNLGVVWQGREAVLIDTGIDRGASSRAWKQLQEEGLELKAILNTHAHADHCGGNAWLSNRLGIPIAASAGERALIEWPYGEPLFLNAGTIPPKPLLGRGTLAEPSRVEIQIPDGQTGLRLAGMELELRRLPGHAVDQLGVAYQDVFFCADALFSSEILEKHGIPFFTDAAAQRETLARIQSYAYQWYVPSHGEPAATPLPMAQAFLSRMNRMEAAILAKTRNGAGEESVMSAVLDEFSIQIETHIRYVLVRTPILAVLQDMEARGLVGRTFSGNRPIWHAV